MVKGFSFERKRANSLTDSDGGDFDEEDGETPLLKHEESETKHEEPETSKHPKLRPRQEVEFGVATERS